MRWYFVGAVLALVLVGLVRIAGPALLEPATTSARWFFASLVAVVLAMVATLAIVRAPMSERAWATLAIVTPSLLAHAILADVFGAVFPMLRETSDRAWSSLGFLVCGVVALVGLVVGRR